MSYNTQSPEKSLSLSNDKDTVKKYSVNQEKTIFQYLQNHIATATMVSNATGIPQKNITRYKRDLEKRGLLFEVEKKLCKVTGFRAWFLTTNKNLFITKISRNE